MDDIEQELREAQDALDKAIKRWVSVKSKIYVDDEDERVVVGDAVLVGAIVIAAYTSIELELQEATATMYFAPDSQVAPLSRGLAMSGVDRWAQYA